MALRALQFSTAGIDCLFGSVLLVGFGRAAWHVGAWQEPALLLIVFSVLPAGVLAVRFPLVAGILQFAGAFIGRQLLHNGPWPDLRLYAAVSMACSLAIVATAVLRGVVEITREAYGEAEHQDDRYAPTVRDDLDQAELKVAAAGGSRNQLWF